MAITIKEIAALAGVSRGTVDRVIHKRGKVDEATAKRIEKILCESNYQGNHLGRALATSNKRYKVGVIFNSVGNEFFDLVLEGLLEKSKQYPNVNLIIKKLKGYEEKHQLETLEKLEKKQLDALIMTPINSPKITTTLNEFSIPIVFVNNDSEAEKIAFVGCDYFNSGALSGDLANGLLPEGGKIAIIIGNHSLKGHAERVAGFKSIFQKGMIDIFENQDDNDLSFKLTTDIIGSKKYNLIYYAAAGIKGGLNALNALKVKLPIITVDETPAVITGLQANQIFATVTQQPFKQGAVSLQIMVDYLVYGIKPISPHYITNNRVILKHSIQSSGFATEE